MRVRSRERVGGKQILMTSEIGALNRTLCNDTIS